MTQANRLAEGKRLSELDSKKYKDDLRVLEYLGSDTKSKEENKSKGKK